MAQSSTKVALWVGPYGPAVTTLVEPPEPTVANFIKQIPLGKPFWIVDYEDFKHAFEDLGPDQEAWELDEEALGEPSGVGDRV